MFSESADKAAYGFPGIDGSVPIFANLSDSSSIHSSLASLTAFLNMFRASTYVSRVSSVCSCRQAQSAALRARKSGSRVSCFRVNHVLESFWSPGTVFLIAFVIVPNTAVESVLSLSSENSCARAILYYSRICSLSRS